MTNVYGKYCNNNARFFVRGGATSKDMRSIDMRPLLPAPLPEAAHTVRAYAKMDPEDMSGDSCEPEDDALETVAVDHYELAMAPECLTMDLPVQIAVFMYAYAKLCCCSSGMTCWVSTQTIDAGSLCIWTLIATTWAWVGTVFMTASDWSANAPSMSTFIGGSPARPMMRTGPTRAGTSSSSKGLQKNTNANALTYEAFRHVLSTGRSDGGVNCGIRTGHSLPVEAVHPVLCVP